MNATENDSLNRPFVVFNEANLENIIDISYLETEPDKINWAIDNGDKWDYKTLKEEAIKKYTVLNKPRDYREKNKNKILLAHYIFASFEGLKDLIAQEYGIVLESSEYDNILKSQNPLIQEFPNKLKTLAHSFVKKIKEIQRDWYEDWKNFGDIEDIEPIEEKLRGMNASKRADEVKKIKNYYIELYKAGGGDDNNNPLKWWIKHKAIPSLDTSKRLSLEKKEAFLNTQKYTKETVERALENYLLDVGRLPNNNLLQAYQLLEEILDYVARFGTINYDLNFKDPWSFKERVSTLDISKGYDINPQPV